jgi:hypothetical protein
MHGRFTESHCAETSPDGPEMIDPFELPVQKKAQRRGASLVRLASSRCLSVPRCVVSGYCGKANAMYALGNCGPPPPPPRP